MPFITLDFWGFLLPFSLSSLSMVLDYAISSLGVVYLEMPELNCLAHAIDSETHTSGPQEG